MTERAKGKVQEGIGATKERVGKATGNKSLQSKGMAEKRKGQVRKAVGGVIDKAQEVKKKVT